MPDLIAFPVRHKGLRHRRLDDFVGAAASIGGWGMVSRNPIDRTDEEGNRDEGLYPLLESILARLGKPGYPLLRLHRWPLTDRHTVQRSIQPAKAKSPGRSAGFTIETSGRTEAERFKTIKTPKRTNQASRGAPSTRHHRSLKPTPPRRQRRTAFQNRIASTAACLTTTPTHAT